MKEALLVGLGGFVGATARHVASGWVHRAVGTGFPWGTFVVNVAGCLLIGLMSGLGEARGLLRPELRAFLLVGLLGGFTTFSTFAYESLALGRGGHTGGLLLNVGGQVLLGIGAVWVGHLLGRTL